MSNRNLYKRKRVHWLEFIKKQYDLYKRSEPEDFRDFMAIIREAVLLAPNYSSWAGNKNPINVVNRNEYLDKIEEEVKDKNYIVEEYEFDSFVFEAPNVIGEDGFNMDSYAKNWKELHPSGVEPKSAPKFKKNS